MALGFTSSQNNAKDKKDVNTRSMYQFMNVNGFDPSTLVVGYWNNMLSLKMHPALPKDQRSEKRVYDYDKKVITSLPADIVRVLIHCIEHNIIPAMESGEAKSVGIQCGADSLITVGTGVKQTGAVRPYIAIHKGIDSETRIANMSIAYEFERGAIIDEYDATTGKYSGTTDVHNEFYLFIDMLKASIYAMSGATAHSIRVADSWIRDKYLANQSAIASKLGVSLSSGYSSGYNKSSSRVSFGSQSQETESSYANSETLSSMDDLDSEIPFDI